MTYVSPTGDTRHYWHRPGTGWLMYMNYAIHVRDLRRSYGPGDTPSRRSAASTSTPARLDPRAARHQRRRQDLDAGGPRRAGGPRAGEVSVLGLDPIADRAAIRRRPGVLLQRSGFSGDLTVRETLRHVDRDAHRPAPGRRDAGAARLDARADVRMLALSGGEPRRVDLACTLMGRPELRDPRRAHHRPGPREPARRVAARRRPARRRRDRAAHDALPRGGRDARRPAGDHARRADRPGGNPARSSGPPVHDRFATSRPPAAAAHGRSVDTSGARTTRADQRAAVAADRADDLGGATTRSSSTRSSPHPQPRVRVPRSSPTRRSHR